MELNELTIHELKDKLNKKECTIPEIVSSYFKKIKEAEPKVDAYLTLLENEAMDEAKTMQEKFDKGESTGILFGIPIAIKDAICTKGVRTTSASKILDNFISPYDATVMEKLHSEGAIMLGKTNMDEFAMGSSTEHSAYKTTKNPWDLSRIPGGSSGGSAAAVAAGMAPCALGSDTGGSIRQPASLCGIVGLKPTYGLVSRYGLIAYASSFDQIGPFTRDVEDLAILLNAISGHDEKDTTSENREKEDYTEALVKDVKDIKIGVPKEFLGEGVNEEVKEVVLKAAKKYEELGAKVEECSFKVADYSLATYYIIACAEASSNLGRFDGIRYGHRASEFKDLKELFKKTRQEGFGDEVKRRIFLGTCVLSSGYSDAYYVKAQKVRNLLREEFAKQFEKYDFLLTPTSPTTAFKIGEKMEDPLEMYLADICTVPVNVAGVPAISIPCGYSKDGLPIGMQLIGNYFSESKMIRTAYTYEQNTEWHNMHPNI
ncbi:MAG: Asp-tRNA(Asn)/Glu-tRNA(Gln) amidotransferase subunit GatA [Clostridia bacterium]|nr:Asp-tRNA(Asn)/Glu-tRNA(Gln) amidotransferase subunit GatA [Clostridia bacterium]